MEKNLLIKGNPIHNFGYILDYHATTVPSKIFIIDLNTGAEFTYSEFNVLVDKTVNYLHGNNLKSGDILSVTLENSVAFLLFYFASLKTGIIINPFPISLEYQELIRYLDYIKPKLAIVNANTHGKLEEIYKDALVLKIDEKGWLNKLNSYSDLYQKAEFSPDNPACLYYSSGTTGNPKGILFSHRNMLTNISSLVSGFHFTDTDNHLVFLPFGHTAAINYSILPSAFVGATLTIAKSIWSIREDFWEIIARYGITYLEMVPTALQIILNMPQPKRETNISSLKWIGCGSAPLSRHLQVEFEEKFKVRVGNLYGLSETGPTHIDYPLAKDWVCGSIGFPLSVNACKIIDENGKEVSVGEIGEIAIKGENVFIGYYKNQNGYQQVVRDNYFFTGDLGYQDSAGRFYFIDRKKDLIIKGGINIHPGEIEDILIAHPDVGEVSVISVPDQIMGEEIVAFVSLRNNSRIDSDGLISYCKQYLSRYKLPKRIIFVDKLPKGHSGKILRRRLKENYLNEQV